MQESKIVELEQRISKQNKALFVKQVEEVEPNLLKNHELEICNAENPSENISCANRRESIVWLVNRMWLYIASVQIFTKMSDTFSDSNDAKHKKNFNKIVIPLLE